LSVYGIDSADAFKGKPQWRRISTSYVERNNLTFRVQMRRFTRLTNGSSEKLENLRAMVWLFVAYYNSCRVHGSLRVTPAMAAGTRTGCGIWPICWAEPESVNLWRVARKTYSIKALVFQEGEWLSAQCLEYNLATQARTLPELSYELQRLIFGHIATRLANGLEPFADLERAPQRFWDMYERSKIPLETDTLPFKVRKQPVKVTPKLRVAPPEKPEAA
jgi:hypothetical protein